MTWLRLTGAGLVLAVLLSVLIAGMPAAPLHAQASVALTGQVTSAADGPMEGVLVTARRIAAKFSVTVVTDEYGDYSFPAGRLEPGRYALTIRADGYELDHRAAANVEKGKTNTADLMLRKTPEREPTLSRGNGRGTRVIVTEYDLPRSEIQPYDLIVDADGIVWFSNRRELSLGRFDPKTGNVQDYELPLHREEASRSQIDLDTDTAGNLWLGLMHQGGIAKFDKQHETFQTWYLPHDKTSDANRLNRIAVRHSTVDGKVWSTDAGGALIHRFDLRSGEFETFDPDAGTPPRGRRGSYQVVSDTRNNAYFAGEAPGEIGRIDATTGKVTLYQAPDHAPAPGTAPRRISMDAQDRLWFADMGGERIVMFDTRTQAFKAWPLAAPATAPDDVVADDNGEVWSSGADSDRVRRLDPGSGRVVEYLLPLARDPAARRTEARRAFIDGSTRPATFWIGSNHGASIIKLEPLD